MTLVITEPLSDHLIPFELLTWTPAPEDVKTVFKNGDYERKLHTNTLLDPRELELVRQLRALQRELGVSIKRTMQTRLTRHLSHARSDVPKALESLVQTQEWRRSFFNPPLTDAHDDAEHCLGQYLNAGFVYFCGRDKGYRPFLFVVPAVAFENKWSVSLCEKMFAFCLEYALRYLFIPGKVESIVVVFDCSRCSTWQLRSKEVTNVASMLSKTYVGRMSNCLVTNAPGFVAGIWAVAKHFLSDRQQAKTIFLKKKDIRAGRSAKHQIEVQYGGSLPNLTVFYPFHFAPPPFTPDYDGDVLADAIPFAYKCINGKTAVGMLAENNIVEPVRWNPRSPPHILSEAGINVDKCPRRGGGMSGGMGVSIISDFPLDEEFRELRDSGEEPKDRTTRLTSTISLPQIPEPISEPEYSRSDSDGEPEAESGSLEETKCAIRKLHEHKKAQKAVYWCCLYKAKKRDSHVKKYDDSTLSSV